MATPSREEPHETHYFEHGLSESQKRDIYVRKTVAREKQQEDAYVAACQEDVAVRNMELRETDTYLRGLPFQYIHPLSPDTYIREKLDVAPPVQRRQPTIRDAEKSAGITLVDPFLSLFSQKRRVRLFAQREQAEKLQKKQMEEYTRLVEIDTADYHKRVHDAKTSLCAEIDGLSARDASAARRYFSYAIARDDFSVDGVNRYHPGYPNIIYSPDTGDLRITCRLPDYGDVPCIDKYFYSEKGHRVDAKLLPIKDRAAKRLCVAESVLLRTVAMIFLSDRYGIVDAVEIAGYLRYFDSAYGNNRTKNVIRCRITRDVFNEVSLEWANPLELFGRVLNADISRGLYEKEPHTLREVERHH